ncbi:MAG: methyltransferase domain-containing protein [Bacillota bacterium]
MQIEGIEVVEGKTGLKKRRCRFCRTPLEQSFVDLKAAPLSNSYLNPEDLNRMEPFYPLHAYVCSNCFLVQLEEMESPEAIFEDYAYFSSYSKSWLEHARAYAEMAQERLALNSSSRVVEIGSNDGYLLRFFKEMGIGVLGIEPAANVAGAARELGIETVVRFFGRDLAGEIASAGEGADLLIGNNVLAHIPDVNDLMQGLKVLLNPGGVINMEFPHLLSLIEENQFDTIYHEHYSYFSLSTAALIFSAHQMELFDAEQLNTHGGSLRIYACHAEELEEERGVEPGGAGLNSKSRPTGSACQESGNITDRFQRSERLKEMLEHEEKMGFKDLEFYRSFAGRVEQVKRETLKFLIKLKEEGHSAAAYGAPAKGNTLLNYCGIGPELIEYTVDISPHKQGKFLPGSRIPIFGPEKIEETKPEYLIILPWNLQEEIEEQMAGIRQWGGKFVTFIPEVRVW